MKHKKDIFRLSFLGEGGSPETRGSINNDINILDSRVFANAMHKNDSRMSESGRSMVEMLGTLAIIGVLSIGGIMGYSYGMDKYRANQTINDIMLKMVDIVSTANQSGVPDSTSWPTKNPIGYPVSFLKDIPNDRYGIQIQNVPSRVCKMVGDALKNTAIVYVSGEEHNTNEQDPCDSSDKNTMEFYFETLKCEPACGTEEICLWGECVSNRVEITPWEGAEKSCSENEDCGPCGVCYGSDCFPANGKDCIIKIANDGMCQWGECIPKTGCNNENPCQGSGEYCASPNSSAFEAFPNGSTGACIKADYREMNVASEIYYISNTTMSWWDADAFCRSLGYSGLVTIDDLLVKNGAVRTDLGNAIYNSTNNPNVWTNETFLYNNEKHAKFINLDSIHITSYATVGVYHHAVCK